MLTGDNPLTAVSIAHSSGLVDPSFESIILQNCDFKEITSKLLQVLEDKSPKCIVLTGTTQAFILNNPDAPFKRLFVLAVAQAKCFIGCRISPKQKAEMVLLIKENFPGESTLAIGDGANDVNMITSADVGIGITGVEGTQAARASDYSIGQFSFLQRLLFIHGRESYRKNSFAVGYILWKNFLFVLPNILIGFSSGFSAVNLYDPIQDVFYNLLFTAYPIGWFACVDKEYQYKYLANSPKMYTPGIQNRYFNQRIFWKWYFYSLILSILIYNAAINFFNFSVDSNSSNIDISALGTIIFSNIVLFVNFKLTISTNSHDWISISVQFLSVFFYFLILYITSSFSFFESLGCFQILARSMTFYLETVIVLMGGLMLEYTNKSIYFFIYEVFMRKAKHAEIIQPSTGEKYKDTDDLIEEADMIKDIDNLRAKQNFEITTENKIIVNGEFMNISYTKDERNEDQKDYLENHTYKGFAYTKDDANTKIIMNEIKRESLQANDNSS